MHNPKYQNPNTVIGGAVDLGLDEQNGLLIDDALRHYYAREGSYPKSLADLVPEFVSDPALFHSKLDRDTDPDGVSWNYFPPAPKAGSSYVVLELTEQLQTSDTSSGQYARYNLKVMLGGDEQVIPIMQGQ
jgi:hypothetical protein